MNKPLQDAMLTSTTPALSHSTNTAISAFASGSSIYFGSTSSTGCFRSSAARPRKACTAEPGPQGHDLSPAPSAPMHIGTVNMLCAIIITLQDAVAAGAPLVHTVKDVYSNGDDRANRSRSICDGWRRAIGLNGRATGAVSSALSAGRI